jgi:hypothetical protein
MSTDYILITPAKNEEAFIEKTIDAVLGQTLQPRGWVIVSDGSTDRTDAIVESYARRHSFLRLVGRTPGRESGFASKVAAFRMGYDMVRSLAHHYVGNLDADVSFEPTYYERVIARFTGDPKLGLAGGVIHERKGGAFLPRAANSTRSVAGAIQLFRRACFEDIGGHLPLSSGGEDWVAEVMAKIGGWTVQAFEDLPVHHHRGGETADRRVLKTRYREGVMDYSLGSHPLFEALKCLRRVSQKPFVVGSVLRMAGFAGCYLQGAKRAVPESVVQFLRQEQMRRIRSLSFSG